MSVEVNELKLVVSMLVKDGKEFKKLENQINGIGKTSKKVSGKGGLGSVIDKVKSMKTAMLGTIGTIVAVGTALYKMAERGLAINKAEKALVGFVGSAEEAEKVILAVQEASGGMLTKFEATKSASKLFAMGLADSAEEAAKLTKIAITLGASMDRGPTEAFEDFALMLANQSIPRLDTFGMSGAAVRKRIIELQKETKGLSREQAFMQAVMEQGTVSLDKLASSGFEASSSLDRMKTRFRQAMEGAATYVADGLMPLIDKIDEAIEKKRTLEESFEAEIELLDEVAENYDEYATELIRIRVESGKLDEVNGELIKQLYIEGDAIQNMHPLIKHWASLMGLVTRQTYDTREETAMADQALMHLTQRLTASKDPIKGMGDALLTTLDAETAFKNEMTALAFALDGQLADAQRDYIERQDAINDEIADMRKQMEAGTGSADELGKSIAELEGELESNSAAYHRHTDAMIFDIVQKQLARDLEQGLIQDLNNSGSAYDEYTSYVSAAGIALGQMSEQDAEAYATIAELTGMVETGTIGVEGYAHMVGLAADKQVDAADATLGLTEAELALTETRAGNEESHAVALKNAEDLAMLTGDATIATDDLTTAELNLAERQLENQEVHEQSLTYFDGYVTKTKRFGEQLETNNGLLKSLVRQLESIPEEINVAINIETMNTSGSGGSWPGAPGHFAGGGFAPGERILVGELGPEYIEAPFGGRVVTNENTRNYTSNLTVNNHGRGGMSLHELVAHEQRQRILHGG